LALNRLSAGNRAAPDGLAQADGGTNGK
jgi:hypothetical protein